MRDQPLVRRFDDSSVPQKITFGDMREMGVRGVLVYCADSTAAIA
jgi:hypothetical protein